MEIRVEPAACALQHGDQARAPSLDAAGAAFARVPVEQHARVHPQHRAAQPVIPRHPVAQPIRYRQHPLPHRHPRQHIIHQMRGALGHAAAPAARAEAAALAGKRHQVIDRAVLAAKPRHAAREHAAHQELPELALDELGEADTIAGLDRRAQEGLQV